MSSCVCVIIPNLTRGQRPYAFIENVVTDKNYRKKGFATACLDFARKIAQRENCYKMMLLTGSKQDSTLKFYERAITKTIRLHSYNGCDIFRDRTQQDKHENKPLICSNKPLDGSLFTSVVLLFMINESGTRRFIRWQTQKKDTGEFLS